MKAFLLLVAIFLFSNQAETATGQSDPANIACYQSGGSCRLSCLSPGVVSGDCAGGLVCCIWPRQRPV
ncbi:Gallinacin-9 [Crotalus adamanteus]|uniref:Gallinacin-9 n=1 Tax=Crotalus adamanteus TaxID=8729 RepID=A0AAW1CEF6_CROAD